MTDPDLREQIKRSNFKTQERFAIAAGISEAVVSKYCRGLIKPKERHAKIIRRLLHDENRN